ncbi:hypothetical protein SPLC1_S531570 [Arthrospira platensis C1]|nr:hypothetical protein SPLC1_S531570 [Arthrospira platensis C1]
MVFANSGTGSTPKDENMENGEIIPKADRTIHFVKTRSCLL